ncbi:DNA/RNA helicase [Lactobacillus sp.] [Lactiplantibacillus mudanjiangensis]|uniref:DEAD/DEAH box helicase n=1 Tax=Lactiplantibacillus mudanjiangensis TaxID=1296538 RepID=UPI001014CABE|nr:helicase-related protein [Lactiplantibacillus mudanjiangensis]VDG32342.1 DNA/RNA helicase [Lactobacillus sp.] [Lactiplantibacillus mudanjiangensis]
MQAKELYGRQLLLTPVEAQQLPAGTQKLPALKVTGQQVQCLRCGSQLQRRWAQLPDHHYYCYQCLTLGRVSTLTSLYHLPEPNAFTDLPSLTWDGQLTGPQTDCANRVKAAFQARQRHLLWAVTGAGKTEMLFPGLAWALQQGLRVAVASPRVDVCLELAPRLQAAFATTTVAVLHGRQPAPYVYRQLTVCTTHQLLRFREAFDVLVIDEVDAFPFAANPRLTYAVEHAVKPTGAVLYLTATPSRELLQQVKRGQLTISYLPLRFHRHLLPKIQVTLAPKWWSHLQHGKLIKPVQRWLTQYATSGRRFLIFVPRISQLAIVQAAIQRMFPKMMGLTVYSADPERLDKVQQMRDQQVQYLVTTTILERGVTLPGIDVIVLGADDAVFSTAALVQIAGRVGRSRDRPTGAVHMVCASHARHVKQAQRQINLVNRKGQRLLNELSTLSTTANH